MTPGSSNMVMKVDPFLCATGVWKEIPALSVESYCLSFPPFRLRGKMRTFPPSFPCPPPKSFQRDAGFFLEVFCEA